MIPKHIKALILDMDGVLWRDETPIGNLANIFNHIEHLGLKVILATNNGTKTAGQYLEKLNKFNVKLESWQIVTSAMAVADKLAKDFPNRGDTYVVGESGVKEALRAYNFNIVAEGQTDSVVAVVAGIDREITFWKLREATLLIRRGVPFYGTNPDRTFPTPAGLIPGAGAILASLTASTDIEPIVVGKPAPHMLNFALGQLGTSAKETLVVGDRLETDIAGGHAVGCPTALVLSGVSTCQMAEGWMPAVDIISEDLESLIGIKQ